MNGKINIHNIGNLLVSVFVLILINSQLHGQQVSIKAELDTNAIVIGDQINLTFEVLKSKDYHIDFPVFNQKITENIDVLSASPIDSSDIDNDKILLRQKLLITAFDSGLYYIPPIPFVLNSNEYSDTLFTGANYLEVFSVPIDTTGTIRDIKALYKAPVSISEIYPYILLTLFLALATWFLVYYYKRRKDNKPVFSRVKPEEPAHIIAIRELDRVKAEKLWQKQQTKEYYTRLTNIIRMYIERRFGIKAMEETTEEILHEFDSKIADKNINIIILKELLSLADLVKFAKEQPLPEENLNHLENAYVFVKETRIKPEEEPVNKPAGAELQEPNKVLTK